MLRTSYVLMLSCMICTVFYYIYTSQPRLELEDETSASTFAAPNLLRQEYKQERQRAVDAKTSSTYDLMHTDPNFLHEERTKALQERAIRGAATFEDIQATADAIADEIEQTATNFVSISSMVQEQQEEQRTINDHFKQDQKWLQEFIKNKQEILKGTVEKMKVDPLYAGFDIETFVDMLNTSVAGKILRYINKQNKHFYGSHVKAHGLTLVGITPDGHDVFKKQLTPDENIDAWRLELRSAR